MTELKNVQFDELKQLIKAKELSYFNFYNTDIPIPVHYTSQYYLNQQYDTIEKDQIVNTLFYDIEVHVKGEMDISKAEFPINAITTCTSSEKIYKAFYLLCDFNYQKFGISADQDFDINALIENHRNKLLEDLKTNKYIDDSFGLELYIFNDEKELLIAFCQELHNSDAHFISGWNTSLFDLPYIYNRMCLLFGKDNTNSMLSQFGVVNVIGNMVSITEYITADLLYLYKPRGEGGLNLGSTQNNYSLDNVAFVELGLKKIEYKGKEVDLNKLYENDPYMFLLYNIVDVVLCYKLNEKLKHIELYNLIRRLMRTSMSSSLIGSSALFDTFVYSKLSENNQFIRFGISNETGQNVNEKTIANFPIFKDKKGVPQKLNKISIRDYNSIVTKFPGAFVNDPNGRIINDGSLVIDLDASSLYPSMIKQFNISFDTYIGRIIPPCTYKTIVILEQCLGNKNYPDALPMQIEKLCWNYVDSKKTITQKKQTAQRIYYILLYLFDNLMKPGIPINQIFQPKTNETSILLKTQLIPLMDLINTIHPENPGYNVFSYDYLFMPEEELNEKYPKLYIIENPSESSISLKPYSLSDARGIIKQFIITLSGCLFYKHEKQTGMFVNFLNNMGIMRKNYKKARNEQAEDSYLYGLNDSRQKSVKVIMNTTKLLVLILVIICSKSREFRGSLSKYYMVILSQAYFANRKVQRLS